MMLFHVTPEKNCKSIGKRGLLVKKALSEHKETWLVSESQLGWAILRVHRRHAYRTVAIYAVNPLSTRRRQAGRLKVWATTQDTPPDRIQRMDPNALMLGSEAQYVR